MGRIKSLKRKVRSVNYYSGREFYRTISEHILKPGRYCKSGHVSVVLGHGEKGIPVHQLIMKTFVGEKPEGMEVLHKNGNPKDNRLENLRYGTRTENILDVFYQGKRWRKLNINDVYYVRKAILNGVPDDVLAKELGVAKTTIADIRKGRRYKWLK